MTFKRIIPVIDFVKSALTARLGLAA